jgi:hypothetical protein
LARVDGIGVVLAADGGTAAAVVGIAAAMGFDGIGGVGRPCWAGWPRMSR